MHETLQDTVTKLARQAPLGSRVRVRHIVRVGLRSWPIEVTGVVREIAPVLTGIHTDRVAADAIWVPSILIEKADGELSRLTLDEQSQVEVLKG